jgi:uncharacterized protein YaaN involved in tellurite resistance
MEQDSAQQKVIAGMDNNEIRQTDLVEVGAPKPPNGMSEEEAQKVKNEANALVKQLGTVSGSRELEILDSMSNMGMQTQRNASGYLDLLKGRVSTFLADGGPSHEIADSMRELRITLDQIDPHAKPKTVWDRLYNLFPFFGMRNPVRLLQKIALRYEPVSRQVTVIETRLRDGRTMLVRDNIELRKLYEQLEVQQPAILRTAYLGELLMAHLTQMIQNTPDAMKRERIRAVLHDVAMRVQDLHTMNEVHVQYFVSIEMSRQNNNRLGQAVDRTLTLSTNVITVGLAIQSALIRQRSVMEATKRTREFLGTLIAANASSIKTHTKEIGDLYINPVIAMDKITQAHNDLIEAMDAADQLRQEGISVARENIAKLSELSETLIKRAGSLLEDKTQTDEIERIDNPEKLTRGSHENG